MKFKIKVLINQVICLHKHKKRHTRRTPSGRLLDFAFPYMCSASAISKSFMGVLLYREVDAFSFKTFFFFFCCVEIKEWVREVYVYFIFFGRKVINLNKKIKKNSMLLFIALASFPPEAFVWLFPAVYWIKYLLLIWNWCCWAFCVSALGPGEGSSLILSPLF